MAHQARAVYDTAIGRLDRRPGPRDGVVRVLRDRKQRRGKVVTLVAGLPGGADALARVAGELKRRCGCGGTVKGDVVEIQGDHRERVAAALRERGYTVKLAGG